MKPLTRIASIATTVILAAALASCGTQEESKVDKAADVTGKAEGDAKAIEALAGELSSAQR